MLQRIYGTAFATQAALDEHLKLIEEAKARDHRKLGKELDLFIFDQTAPAMPFFLPRGAFIYNHARAVHARAVRHPRLRGSDHPRRSSTRSCSGRAVTLGNYNENMYRLWTEDLLEDAVAKTKDGADKTAVELVKELQDNSFAVKPMNCPRPLRDLRIAPAQLSRAAVAHGRLRSPSSLRARRRGARSLARSHVLSGRRARLLHP